MNVLNHIPFSETELGKRKVAETEHTLIMQIALKSGQSVEKHEANTYAHLLVLTGEIELELPGAIKSLSTGDIEPVTYLAPMQIHNRSETDATFLVIKAPHPDRIHL